jgi:hypothetical protein
MEYDFTGCLANVFAFPPTTNLLKEFPQVFGHEIYKVNIKGLTRGLLLRYIVAVYDIKGLRRYFPEIDRRKLAALEISGFKTDGDGNYSKEVISMISGATPNVNRMIIQYCRSQRNPDYTYIVSLEAMYTKMAIDMADGNIDKIGALKIFRETKDELTDKMVEFLAAENNKPIQSTLLEYIEEDGLGITPEEIAENRSARKPLVDVTPYGRDYGYPEFDNE